MIKIPKPKISIDNLSVFERLHNALSYIIISYSVSKWVYTSSYIWFLGPTWICSVPFQVMLKLWGQGVQSALATALPNPGKQLDIAAWTWPPPSIAVIFGRKTTNQVANQAGFPRSSNLVSIWLGIFANKNTMSQPSASFWQFALGLTFHLTSSARKGGELSHREETDVCRMKSLLNCWRRI